MFGNVVKHVLSCLIYYLKHVLKNILNTILRIHCAIAPGIHSLCDNGMTKFMVNKRTDAQKTDINFLSVTIYICHNKNNNMNTQCFRQSAPLRESRIAIRDGPQKNEKGANLALSFDMSAGLTQEWYFKSHPRARNRGKYDRQCN